MFNQYPYLNLNDLNLDYILKAIKEMRYEVTNFVSINAIKYADPIQWNITSQYEKNTIVIDPVTGTAYISVAPVPAGVALTRPEYWTVVFDLGSFVTRAAQNFTEHWESETTTTATFNSNMGNWLVWGDVLYKALVNITAGDTYVVGSNIEHFTIEDLYNSYLNMIAMIMSIIGDLDDLATTDKTSIVNAINDVVNVIIGDLDNLNTTDKSSVVNAINAALTTMGYRINVVKFNISPYTEVIDPDTGLVSIEIPQYSVFWRPNGNLAFAVTDIHVGDTLQDNVNYYPCTIYSLLMNVFTVNNLVVRSGVKIDGDLQYKTPTPISGTRSTVEFLGADNNNYDLLAVNSAGDITILLADSTETHTGYGEKYRQIARIPSANFVNLAADSSNIASGLWRGFLTSWCNNHPDDLVRVKTIIASGGGNDSSDTALPNLDTEIKNLCDYVHAHLPNATIYFAYNAFFLAKSAILNGRDWWHRMQAESIWSKCGKYGGVYLDTKAVLHNWDFWDASTDGVHPDVDSADAIAATLYAAVNGGCPYIDYKLYSPIAFQLLAANATVTQGDVVEYMQGNVIYISFNDVIIESTDNNTFFTVQNGAQSLAKYLGHFTCGAEVTGTTFFVAIEDANNNEHANVPCTLSLTGNPDDGYKQYMALYFRDLTRGYTCTKIRLNGVISVPVMRL